MWVNVVYCAIRCLLMDRCCVRFKMYYKKIIFVALAGVLHVVTILC